MLLAILLAFGPAIDGAARAGDGPQFRSHQPEVGARPESSRCMARCVEMERQCQELEKQFPTCSTIEICDEEKLQCEALCRFTAELGARICA